MKHALLLAAAALLPGSLQAQPAPYGLTVDRDTVRVQQAVKVVVNFEAASRWCGLRVDLGDGDVRDIVVEDFPLTLSKQYAAPGRYVLRAQGRFMPRGITSALGCDGSARAVTVTVDEAGNEGRKRDAETTREQRKRDEELAREQRKRDAEQARERDKRDREDRRAAPGRDARPTPAPAPSPTPVPAAPASKPRDGTFKVF